MMELYILLPSLAIIGYLSLRIWKLKKELNQVWTLPEGLEEILPKAKVLTAAVEGVDAPGEYKKFQMVYSKLQKLFPEIPKYKLALAIELAVNEWRK